MKYADDDERTQALAALPHGPGFRFLDQLNTLELGQWGEGVYRVPEPDAAPFLAAHFPGDPILPGVLLVEAAAQLAGTVAQSDPNVKPLKSLRLTAMRGIKILGTARPGEVLVLEARIVGRIGGLIQAQVQGRVGQQQVLSGEVTLSGETTEDRTPLS